MTTLPPYPPPDPWNAPAEQPPGVLVWFKVYAGVMTALYLLVVAMGVLFLVMPPTNDPDFTPEEQKLAGVLFVALGLPIMAAFVAAFFLPRRKWVWIYDLVLICVGLTSCCFWPICIPLLIFFLMPPTRNWFGWT